MQLSKYIFICCNEIDNKSLNYFTVKNLLAGSEFLYVSAELLPTLFNCDLNISLVTIRSFVVWLSGPDSKEIQFISGYSA